MKIYIVSPMKNKKAGGVFSFAFDSDQKNDAEKFAADLTRSSWERWGQVSSPSGFSGCEGLLLYVHESIDEDTTKFRSICAYVQGQRFDPDHFDAR